MFIGTYKDDGHKAATLSLMGMSRCNVPSHSGRKRGLFLHLCAPGWPSWQLFSVTRAGVLQARLPWSQRPWRARGKRGREAGRGRGAEPETASSTRFPHTRDKNPQGASAPASGNAPFQMLPFRKHHCASRSSSRLQRPSVGALFRSAARPDFPGDRSISSLQGVRAAQMSSPAWPSENRSPASIKLKLHETVQGGTARVSQVP